MERCNTEWSLRTRSNDHYIHDNMDQSLGQRTQVGDISCTHNDGHQIRPVQTCITDCSFPQEWMSPPLPFRKTEANRTDYTDSVPTTVYQWVHWLFRKANKILNSHRQMQEEETIKLPVAKKIAIKQFSFFINALFVSCTCFLDCNTL